MITITIPEWALWAIIVTIYISVGLTFYSIVLKRRLAKLDDKTRHFLIDLALDIRSKL